MSLETRVSLETQVCCRRHRCVVRDTGVSLVTQACLWRHRCVTGDIGVSQETQVCCGNPANRAGLDKALMGEN